MIDSDRKVGRMLVRILYDVGNETFNCDWCIVVRSGLFTLVLCWIERRVNGEVRERGIRFEIRDVLVSNELKRSVLFLAVVRAP